MVELEPSERAFMVEICKLSTDAEEREVLVGLDEEESNFYIGYARSRIAPGGKHRNYEDGERYLELHGKHEQARFQVLGAEMQLRLGEVTRN